MHILNKRSSEKGATWGTSTIGGSVCYCPDSAAVHKQECLPGPWNETIIKC